MSPEARTRRQQLLTQLFRIFKCAQTDERDSHARINRAGGFADAPTPLIAENLVCAARRARAEWAHARMLKRLAAIVIVVLSTTASAEVLDPAPITGWKYEHRAEHFIAGAIIDVASIEAERLIAPQWTHRHPVLAQVVAGLVVGTAACGKEAIDRSRGPEALHHSLGDIACTELGGAAAGIGFTYAVRF